MTNSESDSDDDLNRSIEVSETPPQEDILPLLECPICFNICLPPIKLCVQGHMLCNDCVRKITLCPLCQSKIGRGRNYFAEDFINRSKMKCKYFEDGCEKLVIGENMKKHVTLCHFRPYKCKFCRFKIHSSEFEDHLMKQHKISRWDINDDGQNTISAEKRRNFDFEDIQGLMSINFFKVMLAALAFSFLADQFYDFTSVGFLSELSELLHL